MRSKKQSGQDFHDFNFIAQVEKREREREKSEQTITVNPLLDDYISWILDMLYVYTINVCI